MKLNGGGGGRGHRSLILNLLSTSYPAGCGWSEWKWVSEWVTLFWSFNFYYFKICFRGGPNLKQYWDKKVQNNSLMGLDYFEDCRNSDCFEDCRALDCFKDCRHLDCFEDCRQAQTPWKKGGRSRPPSFWLWVKWKVKRVKWSIFGPLIFIILWYVLGKVLT